MTDAEIQRRAKILDDMDGSAYQCAGILAGLVDIGAVKDSRAVEIVKQFHEATAAYRATLAVDKASA